MEDKTTIIVQGDQNVFRDNSVQIKFVQVNNGESKEEKADEGNVFDEVECETIDANIPEEFLEAAKKVLLNPVSCGYIQKAVSEAAKEIDCGKPTNLAYLFVTMYDFGVMLKRNCYTPFVKMMVAWGVVPYNETIDYVQMANTMGIKVKDLPIGFRSWIGKDKEKAICERIASHFAIGMKYRY